MPELDDQQNLDDVLLTIDKALAWLRGTQDWEGKWAGASKSCDLWFYAMGLKLLNEPAQSDVVQDIADTAEKWSVDGAFGDYPGEPPNEFQTEIIIPFLKWARPDSPSLKSALQYIRRHRKYTNPLISMSRWIFAEEQRALTDNGPPLWLRSCAVAASKVHPSSTWDLRKKYNGKYSKRSPIRDLIDPFLLRIFTYPHPRMLPEAESRAAITAAFHVFLVAHTSLRKIAQDSSSDAQRLYDFTRERRPQFAPAGGLYGWMTSAVVDLFYCETFGLVEESQGAAQALSQVVYKGDGWLKSDFGSTPIFDTGLTVLGLKALGLPNEEPLVRKAAEYLRNARSPKHGLWSWQAYKPSTIDSLTRDTDDCGVALMALSAAGEPVDSEVFSKAAPNLMLLQEESGAFNLYGDGIVRPNWCWLSNTSRSLQGLLLAGVDHKHESLVRGTDWILNQREPNGSWLDGWCNRYIYGTAIALEYLAMAGKLTDRVQAEAVNWLLSQQNADGGWGENWVGARVDSTSEQTGLALYGLCLASTSPEQIYASLTQGTRWLIANQKTDGSWNSSYFMCVGFDNGVADEQLSMAWVLHGLGNSLRLIKPDLFDENGAYQAGL